MNQSKKRRYLWYRICLALSAGLVTGSLAFFEVQRHHGWLVWSVTLLVALFIFEWLLTVAFRQTSRPWHIGSKAEDRDSDAGY